MECKTSLVIGPRTRQDILKGRVIRKLQDGGDVFEDYWTDSDDGSSTVNKISDHSNLPEEFLNVESSNLVKASDYKNSHSSQKVSDSPLKFKEALLNDSVNTGEVEHVSKETCATGLQDITVNLEGNNNNREEESLDNANNNVRSSKLPEITSPVIPEIQSLHNSPLSQTYEKSKTPKIVSKINFKNSKKSISRSTKKDEKIKELQLQYDEYDKKIMQMIHINGDETTSLSVASEEMMPLMLQPFSTGQIKEKSKVEKRVVRTSKNFQEKESVSYIKSQNHNISPFKRIKKNMKSKNRNDTTSQAHLIEKENSATSKSGFVPSIFKTVDFHNSSKLQTTKRQTILGNTINNKYIPEESDLVITSMNTFEKSVDNVSEINRKKTTKSQKKIKKNKSRHVCDENAPEDQHLSKANVSEKSKSSSSKKNLHNAHEQSNHTIRRSARQKFAPLAHWRNERLLYRFENGEIKTIGIDNGTNEDTAFVQQLVNVVYNKLNQKHKKILKPKKAKILDVTKKKKKLIHLHKKFPLVPWNSPICAKNNENSEPGFLIKRMIDTDKNSFGYIHMDVGKTKPPQFMPKEDLQLTVIKGKLEIHVHKNVFIVESKDMFIVPCGAAYTIINIGNTKALIAYAVGKFRFLNMF